MSTKKKRSYTLTSEADLLLEALSKKLGVSKTAILEISIREKAEKENTKLEPQ